jgi:hypothetical protein
MTDTQQYELNIQKTLDGSNMWVTRVLFIGTQQECKKALVKKVEETNGVFRMLDLSIETKDVTSIADGEDTVLSQHLFVNLGSELETHAIFNIVKYRTNS